MIRLLIFVLSLVACTNNSSAPPEYQEVCEDKLLSFEDVQYEPYFQYYEEWLTKACYSKRVGEPCQSYNVSYKLKINECHMEVK